MGLIKKILKTTAGVGVMVAGLPLGAAGLGASIPVYNKTRHLKQDLMQLNNQTKLVCALNDKLANELEQLNSSSVEIGDYVVSSAADEAKQQKYLQIYDKVINSFGELEIVKVISKEEFVNYMMAHGEAIENYIASEEFYGKLTELKRILQDKSITTEEKVYSLKEAISTDEAIFDSQYDTYDRVSIAATVFSLIELVVGAASVFGGFAMMDCASELKDVINGVIMCTLGLPTACGSLIITGD